MRESTEVKRNGIQWTMWQQLDDLDFADDIALISSTQQQMQEKTSLLAQTSIKLGLRPSESKTKVMKINAKRKHPIKIKDTNRFVLLQLTLS
jgi:CRISPR/Cas system CMR-associated protein Cmr3 (group 5 of RAMP superfamily)